MILNDLLELIDDETWLMLVESNGKPHFIWAADYIGGYDPTLEELEPLRYLTVDDGIRIEMHDSPEDIREEVPMLCIDLEEPKEEPKKKGKRR